MSIWMAWKGDGDQHLWWTSTSDGVNWDNPQSREDFNTSQGPALVFV
jgi:hypothetical protein